MSFNIGTELRVDGENYTIIGKIVYRNRTDNCVWEEYYLNAKSSRRRKWLSWDETYREYSISEVGQLYVPMEEFHMVDKGVAEVVSAEGSVDVERGDRVHFKEYEDRTEEKIVSVERWDDGEEVSTGYYLDRNEIQVLRYEQEQFSQGNSYASSGGSKNSSSAIWWIIMTAVFTIGIVCWCGLSSIKSIAKYLEKSNMYIYTTSITGSGKEKADVYRTSYTVDQAVKDIIDGIEGDTEDIQESVEEGDDSVSILTKKEYCIVYTSEDGDTLVQVSTRKYAYQNDNDLYHGHSYTNSFYRRYYYSKGYWSDTSTYSKYDSPYSSYSGDSDYSNYSGDSSYDSYDNYGSYGTYDTYSSSVRQSSINARSSSGGGLSSGK